MKIVKEPNSTQLAELLKRPEIERDQISETIATVFNSVKKNGDKALIEFTKNFDKVELSEISVSEKEFENIEDKISPELKQAISVAKENIFKFHSAQKLTSKKIEISDGISCWQKSVPIQKVGLYIPGGSSPLFSTLLMLGIPAKIAGCEEIVICTPPQKDGNISETILYTANLLGIKKIFKVGGAQAIAALSTGTDSISRVDKIFGPGNQWVTNAKQYANSLGIAIDMPAGPSEVLVIADDSAVPEFVATDLLSQAEHGPDSQVVLISTSEILLNKTIDAITLLKQNLTRKNIIDNSLKNSLMILVKDIEDAVEISNQYAPEHLILSIENADVISDKIKNAGSVFLGNYSPESVGDYASGTNHTLPTSGFASAYSGVSLDSFMKKITFQKLNKNGLISIAKTVEVMADAEGLDAHRLAVTIRAEKND